MNRAQKQVQQGQLSDEQRTIKQLQRIYGQARKDCEQKISELSSRTDLENLQTIIYQKQYQEALKKQLDGILDDLQGKEFTSIADYLAKSYENGYIGVMYDLHKQGIPIIMPINQEQVVKALQTDSKLSRPMYERLGEDVSYLKKSIRAELSRGIANGSSWNQIAGHIANGMNSPFNKAYNNAIRIARTEGHRIQQQSALDSMYAAKEKGADVLKQWDSTLDNRTRPNHRQLDGQIRELDEPFEVDGLKAQAPGYFGKPKEDCNCRCCLLQRARWALDEDELAELKERASYFGLDKTADFEDFKKKYLKLPDNSDTMKIDILDKPIKSEEEHYSKLLSMLKNSKVDYNPVKTHTTKLTNDEIIAALSGGDKTSGSCASAGLAYIGQKQGWNVLDFRGGNSCRVFSRSSNLYDLSCADGIKTLKGTGKSSITVGNRLLKQCEVGKEYYLCVGRHASIVRKLDDGTLQYLELQSPTAYGWTNFDGNPRYTLKYRFGCSSKSDYSISEKYDFMIDIDESDFSTDDFKSILGYINTAEDAQKKGVTGHVR